ncbi:TPA: site-specific DNA-methyltransferase [Bacillus cereus]|nr:site-specific DNA-methyltransferase [Bacillus cereus]
MAAKTRLELNWIGKDLDIRPEPRILIENESLSYKSEHKSDNGGKLHSDNKIIYGDNLIALKALEQGFTGEIKCVYIDPPYNTGNAFAHYDDGVEHSIWLSLLKERLTIIHKLLRDDGSLWISIDDDEAHYLKVLCDEIFGRKNFVNTVIWQKKYSPSNDAKYLSDVHDYIFIYAKNKNMFNRNLLPRTAEQDNRYKNPDNDPRGPWKSSDLSVKTPNPRDLYPITTPSGRVVTPPESRSWVVSKERYEELLKDNRIWFGKSGNNVPSLKRFLSDVQGGVVPKTLWLREEVGDNQEAKKEIKAFNNKDVFTTPKPERLIERILQIATNEGDWVLDSFAGSGTTGAVAHKMGRKWIMVELGEHCHSHIIPRMKEVASGADQGGISKLYNWKGGGGFKYYSLAPSLLKKDKYGNWIVNERYDDNMLSKAVSKINGFVYEENQQTYWKQGKSTEDDYIYVVNRLITREEVERINSELGEQESLLICCKAYNFDQDEYPTITVQKLIPSLLQNRYDYGIEDYGELITRSQN